MDLVRFKQNLVPLLTNSEGDNIFSTFRILTGGMSGIRTAKLLNFATRCLDKGESYVEVGTCMGYTLISAGYQNNSFCVGIDDFSLKEIIKPEQMDKGKYIIKEELRKNLERFGNSNMDFINSDFRNIEFKNDFKIGVLFIDGEHDYKNVVETMTKMAPYFIDKAVVVLDDVNIRDVSNAIIEMATGDYELLAYLASTPHPHDLQVHANLVMNEYISNGIAVLSKKEKNVKDS